MALVQSIRMSHMIAVAIYGLLLGACAHSTGSYDARMPLKPGTDLMQYTCLHLEATSKTEVPMTSIDRDRLVNKIVRKVQVANRYKEINAPTPGAGTLYATIDITDYDSGNAFLRFLLAGLGQIHIDGIMTLEDREKNQSLATYDLSKTFAWGGFYGLGTKIEDVEEGFAKAVVEILLVKQKQD